MSARAGQYDRGHRFLDEVTRWTSATTVLDTRKLLIDAEGSSKAAALSPDEAERLQLRATELSTLEAWGRAYDVLFPAIDAIRRAPDFALGFAELAWRAGEFRTARDVLSGMMPADSVSATTEQWSRKMGWIDGSNRSWLDPRRRARERRPVSLLSTVRKRTGFLVCLGLYALGGAAKPAAAVTAPLGQSPEASPLNRAVQELKQASGVEKYAALRTVWRQWDQTDPTAVEEAIADVERDQAASAPLRAYA